MVQLEKRGYTKNLFTQLHHVEIPNDSLSLPNDEFNPPIFLSPYTKMFRYYVSSEWYVLKASVLNF